MGSLKHFNYYRSNILILLPVMDIVLTLEHHQNPMKKFFTAIARFFGALYWLIRSRKNDSLL